MFPNVRKSAAVALTSVIALSTILSASAQSTTKSLSSNFTLVNLDNADNNVRIEYVKPDGSEWRPAEEINEGDEAFTALGDQLIRRQYDDGDLPAGSGSVVVSTAGPVGAVVQILTRGAGVTPTQGAYNGVSAGAQTANVPLVQKNQGTASGEANSQIIIQNASAVAIDVEVDLISALTGATTYTKDDIPTLQPNASFEYDLADDANITENTGGGWYGSAIVRSTTTGGEVAVVSNLFNAPDTLQSFNAFTESKTRWGVPLFASRLTNKLNTPVAVQNVSGGPIPAGEVELSCTKDAASSGEATFTRTNPAEIANNAAYYFNPVTDLTLPDNWYGACTVDSGTFQTAVFVQLRTLDTASAGAHEGIPLDSTDTSVVIPLYAKRVGNGLASAITILNLTGESANVRLNYTPASELVEGNAAFAATCNVTVEASIGPNGSMIQNHRLEGGDNSVPTLPDGCYGALVVTSTNNRAIHAFVQLTSLVGTGDQLRVHNGFTVAAGGTN